VLEELERNLRALRARAYVRVAATFRELSWLVFEVVMPLLSIGAYVFFYRALGAPERYVGYVVLGGAMTAYWLNVLWSLASQFYWEKQSGQLEIFFLTPVSLMSLLAGMATGGMFMSSARAVGTVVIGSWLFGVDYRFDGIWAGLGIFLLTLVALYGLGMVGASVFMMYGREAWHTSNLLQEPVYLLSGFFFPVRALPRWVAAAAGIIPITLGLDAIRQLVFPEAVDGLLPPGVEAALLAAAAAGFLFLARAALRRLEYLAKREGRLTLRWQ